MRTTLALALGMGVVVAAALWTSRWLDPGTVASTLADIENAADAAAPQSEQIAEPVTEVSETWVEEPVTPAAVEIEPPSPAPAPVAVAEVVEREPVEEPAAYAGVAEPLAVEDEELVVTEPFEEALGVADPFEETLVMSEPEAPDEIARNAEDPASSASRIRRMLDVYRRNVQSER
jgi:hypothetical protein